MNKENLVEIAGICKIALTDEESAQLLEEIGTILAYMEQLSEINVALEEFQENSITFREDIITPSSSEDIRSQFPFSLDNKLKVPRGL